jgi:hypothetical protein
MICTALAVDTNAMRTIKYMSVRLAVADSKMHVSRAD